MVASGDHWDDLISSFANMVGGASGVIYLRSRHCSGVGILGSAGANFGATFPTYLAYYERRSPLLAFYRNRPEGRVSALGQIAFSRAYRETEYFLDWVRPQGYGDMIGGHLVQRPDLYSWLCIRRPDQHGPYTAAEVRSAKRIAPHLGRAICLRARIEAQRGVDRGIRAALENMASGILIVDRCGKVLSANKAAESLLRTNEGLLYSRGNIVCERQQENATLQDAIRAAAQPISLGRSPAFPVSRRNGRRPLTVHIVPLSSVPAWSGFAPSSGVAVVFLVDPEFEVSAWHRGSCRGIWADRLGTPGTPRDFSLRRVSRGCSKSGGRCDNGAHSSPGDFLENGHRKPSAIGPSRNEVVTTLAPTWCPRSCAGATGSLPRRSWGCSCLEWRSQTPHLKTGRPIALSAGTRVAAAKPAARAV